MDKWILPTLANKLSIIKKCNNLLQEFMRSPTNYHHALKVFYRLIYSQWYEVLGYGTVGCWSDSPRGKPVTEKLCQPYAILVPF